MTQALLANDYADLKRRVKAEGLLEPQTAYYIFKTVLALSTVLLAVGIALAVSNTYLLLLDAVFLGFASTQIALLGHDVGHRQAFRGKRSNALGRYFFGNFLLGISHSWWNTKHNQHHATPNHLEKDPDVIFPFIVFAADQISARARFWRPVIALQAFVFVTVLPLQSANMRITSAKHLVASGSKKPWLQAAVIALHFALYGALLYSLGGWGIALAFLAVNQAVFGLYNSSVFASNHKGMAVIREGERLDFLREQVLTSRDITGHRFTDFWFGGLNYQIEHHLFPTMPRNRLPKAKVVVEAFCNEREIPYHTTGLIASYREGFVHLHKVSASLRGGATAAAT
ncbi:MAG: acyl-CoA desaturase [Chloroflexi bacterium]|nr:acyl-CoA desaturase [Chloroflexota bacterium]